MFGIGEYAAPSMAQFAKREKTIAKLADVSFAGSSSAWVKDGNRILRVQTGEVDRAFGGVSVFELDGPTRLRSIQRAARISVADPGRWSLHNVATSRFEKDKVEGDTVGELTLRSTVNPEFLGLAATDPQMLTLHGLASYIDHLRRNNLETASYEIGYWSRIARLFAVIVVTLLALPFVFGPLRTTGAGTRTVVGALLGVVFFLITRTVENGGQLFNLNPALVGWLPTAVVGCLHLDGDIKNSLGGSTRVLDSRSCSARCSGSRYSHSTPNAAGAQAMNPKHARKIAALQGQRVPGVAHRPQAPRTHAEGLPAAQPIERVVAGDDEHQTRAIDIDPATRGGRHHGGAMREEKRAAGKYHQQRGQQKRVVDQCRQSAPEPGTGAADHGFGAAAGFFALGVISRRRCGFGARPAGLALRRGLGHQQLFQGLEDLVVAITGNFEGAAAGFGAQGGILRRGDLNPALLAHGGAGQGDRRCRRRE